MVIFNGKAHDNELPYNGLVNQGKCIFKTVI